MKADDEVEDGVRGERWRKNGWGKNSKNIGCKMGMEGREVTVYDRLKYGSLKFAIWKSGS